MLAIAISYFEVVSSDRVVSARVLSLRGGMPRDSIAWRDAGRGAQLLRVSGANSRKQAMSAVAKLCSRPGALALLGPAALAANCLLRNAPEHSSSESIDTAEGSREEPHVDDVNREVEDLGGVDITAIIQRQPSCEELRDFLIPIVKSQIKY